MYPFAISVTPKFVRKVTRLAKAREKKRNSRVVQRLPTANKAILFVVKYSFEILVFLWLVICKIRIISGFGEESLARCNQGESIGSYFNLCCSVLHSSYSYLLQLTMCNTYNFQVISQSLRQVELKKRKKG